MHALMSWPLHKICFNKCCILPQWWNHRMNNNSSFQNESWHPVALKKSACGCSNDDLTKVHHQCCSCQQKVHSLLCEHTYRWSFIWWTCYYLLQRMPRSSRQSIYLTLFLEIMKTVRLTLAKETKQRTSCLTSKQDLLRDWIFCFVGTLCWQNSTPCFVQRNTIFTKTNWVPFQETCNRD